MTMRTKLRIAAAFWLLLVVGFWFLRGHNTGFTKNQVMTIVHDPVTGIDGPVWTKKFIPGVDFLGVGFLLAALQFGSSFIVRKDA